MPPNPAAPTRPRFTLKGPGEIPDVLLPGLQRAARRRAAEQAITNRYNQLGGSPGSAKTPGDDGLVAAGAGFYREYQKGRIYYRAGTQPVHVYGAIGERYAQLGGPASWLGWPTALRNPKEPVDLSKTDEQPFSEGGRVSTFENGAIYWWPDTGAIDLGHVSVRFSGLACFSETDDGAFSSSDEPYVLFGTVPVPPTAPAETRSPIYGGVDAGEGKADDIELYRGPPYGMALSVTLMEHDSGDPDKFRETVKTAVDQASNGASLAVGQIPYVGPFLAPVAKAFLQAVGPDLVKAVNDLLGTGDEYIDTASMFVSAKDMVTMARAGEKNFRGVLWHLDTPLLSGDGGDYKVYFVVRPV